MSVRPTVAATVTNINTAGQWIVVQTITSRHGPFAERAAAEMFAQALTDSPASRREGK